jgi:hypothetical protein
MSIFNSPFPDFAVFPDPIQHNFFLSADWIVPTTFEPIQDVVKTALSFSQELKNVYIEHLELPGGGFGIP